MVEIIGDNPIAGFYRSRLVKKGPLVAIKVWWGQPLDENGEIMERHMRWQALADGRPIDLSKVWPWCANQPIEEWEYDLMLATARWAKAHAPDRPEASPHEPVNHLKTRIPTWEK